MRQKEVIDMELSERKQKILSSIVSEYIRSGEPVGSKLIADVIGVSSATVRNEMAELIELNLLEQPHTSAGRCPSQKGYRVYIDRLMEFAEIQEDEKQYFNSMLLSSAYDSERLLSCVSRVIASVTKCTAIVTSPSGESAHIKAIQFVQTSRRTAMLVLMSSSGTMKTQVFHCDFDLNSEIMRVFFRVFNEKVAGVAVADITPAFVQGMAVALGEISILAGSAMMALLKVAKDTLQTEVYLSGQMNLLFYPELEHGGARRIMDFLERREDLTMLLKQNPKKISSILGKESGRNELIHSGLTVSRYSINEQDSGAIAILGPMRMDYRRATAILSYLSSQVSQMLTVLMREE